MPNHQPDPNPAENREAPVATYRRRMPVSMERMIENALDWEHLPWLHASSFRSIELETRDRWHWRARAVLMGTDGPTLLELRLHDDRLGWATRTLEGVGAGTLIDTRVDVTGEREIEITVDFFVPGLDSQEKRDAVGALYLGLYEHLYDEDESMMVGRQRALDARENPPPVQATDLGPEARVTASLPLTVETERGRFRVVEFHGQLLAHAAVCPHQLGPLDQCPLDETRATLELSCPWHGYRFDAHTGESSDGRGYRLAAAPRVEIGDDEHVHLVWTETAGNGKSD